MVASSMVKKKIAKTLGVPLWSATWWRGMFLSNVLLSASFLELCVECPLVLRHGTCVHARSLAAVTVIDALFAESPLCTVDNMTNERGRSSVYEYMKAVRKGKKTFSFPVGPLNRHVINQQLTPLSKRRRWEWCTSMPPRLSETKRPHLGASCTHFSCATDSSYSFTQFFVVQFHTCPGQFQRFYGRLCFCALCRCDCS